MTIRYSRLIPLLCSAALLHANAAPKLPPIVSYNRAGGVEMHKDERGNQIPDFSFCGYAANSKRIPFVPARFTVSPATNDATARIQAAIDHVAALPLDTNGLRGAVLLLKGVHPVSGSIIITNSGVILRGQGSGSNGTILLGGGTDRRTLIRVYGRKDLQLGRSWQIEDGYVPVGATGFRVQNAEFLATEQDVMVVRPCTTEWIQRLGASEFGGGVGGGWKPGSRDIVWDVSVKAVGNRIHTGSPITTAIEKEMGGGRMVAYTWPGRISNVGIENLTIESAFEKSNPKDEDHAWCGITFENTQDAWIRQVALKHLAGSGVAIYESCRRVTVQDCISTDPVSEIGGYRRHTFFTMGQQTLFLRCYSEKGRHDFSVGHCAAGPNAFVQCEAVGALSDSGPIESWASGVLYDGVVVDGNAITLGFRPGNNAAIGWSAANSVLWNCSAAVVHCWNPPEAQNWSFGSWAGFEGDGIWRSSNDFMDPASLFAAQLEKRLGRGAAESLKLMPRPHEESSNPPLERAQELAAMAHAPAPTLKSYILNAGTRDPIDASASGARAIETIFDGDQGRRDAASPKQKDIIVITNGWLTCNGRLVVGGTRSVPWWRGTIRPSEAQAAGPAITRFVPGRNGPGFTDDLEDVAESLIKSGQAALDHNYGLWYERRRDDHERVRRMDGNALPPFYEQPFARSGQGHAWDGLSRYDLTKYNQWYWSRLQQFAGICDARGLLLFHQNYFQHNILEAGAHWADFPWRTANNINNTGFPEPPPYAGDKRIFQAELFYDTNHPVRRELHRAYIRQCLNNFTNNANVIQFISAEFTGTLHFMQFWLDTIKEWETEQRAQKSPLIALSATKDVQDAILDDPKRSGTVDIVDFRYWWRTGKGEFAPPGGKNLAPRQFERQWRGGRPSDFDLAGMAAEYRGKNPQKPLICDFDSAGWAWVCAGGSIPRLPRTTDPRLLEAIPKMQPWIVYSSEDKLKMGEILRLRSPFGPHPIWGKDRWGLRQPGEQFLLYVPASASADLDLQVESALFGMHVVEPSTGKTRRVGTVKGGTVTQLSKESGKPLIVWLVKEKDFGQK